jgi:hypothetical protein
VLTPTPGASALRPRWQMVVPDGTSRIERFTDQTALAERQAAIDRELEQEGWTGPHGWNV